MWVEARKLFPYGGRFVAAGERLELPANIARVFEALRLVVPCPPPSPTPAVEKDVEQPQPPKSGRYSRRDMRSR